jgi:DNA repair protein RadC
MAIKDWPCSERPREKLLRHGAVALSDAELLALFLGTGTRGLSAVAVARELLRTHDGLRGILERPAPEICGQRGLGPAKYARLQAALELGRRHLAETLARGDALTNVEDTRRYLTACLRHQRHEVFASLFLDNRHQVLAYEELFQGSIAGASVHPRQVVVRCLHHNAAAVILAHNHPSGVAEPSQADRQITARLQDALALVDVRVLDHIVIGDGDSVSFAERGLL